MNTIAAKSDTEHHLTLGNLKRLLGNLPSEALLYAGDNRYSPRFMDHDYNKGYLTINSDYKTDWDFSQATVGDFYDSLFRIEGVPDDSYVSLRTWSAEAVNGVRLNGDGSITLSTALLED